MQLSCAYGNCPTADAVLERKEAMFPPQGKLSCNSTHIFPTKGCTSHFARNGRATPHLQKIERIATNIPSKMHSL